MSDFKFHTQEDISKSPPRHNELRIVSLPVKVLFEWSDTIVVDYDPETGESEYTSGYIMKVLPGQTFVYHNEPSTLVAQTMKES